MNPITHGGNPTAIRRRLGLGNRPLMDFSVSLNGFGPPRGAQEAAYRATDSIERYPETGAARLTARVAEFHGVPEECVIVGAGTTEIITLIATSLRDSLEDHARELGDPRRPMAHLVEPCYAEYRRACTLNKLRVELHPRPILGWAQDFFPRGATGINWTGHPNNPTGRAWDRATLLGHIERSHSLLTVVDEAYLPFLPDAAERTLIPEVPRRDNVLVLCSLTKVYAIAGLRVGYAIASPAMVAKIKQYQDPWTVTVQAEMAAIACLDDDDYLERTVEITQSESARMMDHLWDIPGVRPAWPERARPEDAPLPPNFILVTITDTPWTSVQVHDAMARRGVLVRECSNYSGLQPGALVGGDDFLVASNGHLRFAVRSAEENDALLAALEAVMHSEPPRA